MKWKAKFGFVTDTVTNFTINCYLSLQIKRRKDIVFVFQNGARIFVFKMAAEVRSSEHVFLVRISACKYNSIIKLSIFSVKFQINICIGIEGFLLCKSLNLLILKTCFKKLCIPWNEAYRCYWLIKYLCFLFSS